MADVETHLNAGAPGQRDDVAAPRAFVLRQVGHLLRRSYAIARRNTAAALETLGDVSPVQASVLGTLAQGPITQAELGRRVGMEPANTHTIVRRMAAVGLVDLGRDPANRRVVLASLTAHGAVVAGQLDSCIEGATARTLAALDADEQKTLINLLSRIVLADDDPA